MNFSVGDANRNPNFLLMIMKNLIFTSPGKDRKMTNRDPWMMIQNTSLELDCSNS